MPNIMKIRFIFVVFFYLCGSLSTASSDTNAPTPNPMTWASLPASISYNTISMMVSIATDDTSAVEYNFLCANNEPTCIDSGWQSSPIYNASDLKLDTIYTFQVIARDQSLNPTEASQLASATTPSSLLFSAIGDYGDGSVAEKNVASLINTWSADLIIGVGDNRYGSIIYDTAVGQDFCMYLTDVGIGPLCNGGNSSVNAFFPVPGNHDYTDGSGINEYLNYFNLPGAGIESSHTSGNERYYDFVAGPVHFFGLDSDGALSSSTDMTAQQNWLQAQLAASTTPWQVVFLHHAPYSSSLHGSNSQMQWPYAAWGADAVIAGHDHVYEHLNINSIPFFVSGLGGRSITSFNTSVAGSQVRYNGNYGAMRIAATSDDMTFEFFNILSELIDSHTIDGSVINNPNVIDRSVSNSNDDVEEELATGNMYFDSTDLELGNDPSFNGDQSVGLRFQYINIPQGATIESAYLRFIVDESGSTATNVVIRAHAVADAPSFSSIPFDLSSRLQTAAGIAWNIATWDSVGQIQNSPDISAVIQELVSSGEWLGNNNIVLIISGTGTRTAESYDGSAGSAPQLHIEFSVGTPGNALPVAGFTFSTSDLVASFTDTSTDSDGSIVNWAWDFSDGSSASIQTPKHTYTTAGTYSVRLTVTDDIGNTDSVTKSVTVSDPPDVIPPSIPALMQVTGVTFDSISLSWNPATDNVGVTGYDLFRDGLFLINVSGTNHIDAGLSTGSTFEYQVRAIDAAGNMSALTDSVFGTTDAIPPDVINLLDATYKAERDEFKVRATSSEQPNVTLEVVGFGSMVYKRGKYEYKLRPVGNITIPPTIDIISSLGALLTVPVVGALPPPLPGQAETPIPADGESDVSISTLLNWTAGVNTDTHEVYFGTTSNPPLLGSQPATGFDPGTLTNATTYYWKVDETNANGTTTGAIWSFTTVAAPMPPGQASNPSPVDDSSYVDLNANLSWSSGSQAIFHDVYFGTSTNPPLISSNQTGTSYDPGTLNELTTYFWRIDEKNALGDTIGSIWSFTTRDANPPDTIVIIKAEWKASRLELKVEATSTSAPDAILTTQGFGQMTYDARKNKYKLNLKPVNSNPGTVSVTSSLGGNSVKTVRLR